MGRFHVVRANDGIRNAKSLPSVIQVSEPTGGANILTVGLDGRMGAGVTECRGHGNQSVGYSCRGI